MNFYDLAARRYSCRKFTDEKVERAQLDRILDAGIAAPTAVNYQPVKIWIMESEQAKETIRSCTKCDFGAETFLVVGADPDQAWNRTYDGRNFGDVDAAIVASHMMLEIEDLGLATTWVGFFDAPKLKKCCPQMANYDLIAVFPVGYPSSEPQGQPSPRHGVRKSREEMTETL